jgi:hypothetical protein
MKYGYEDEKFSTKLTDTWYQWRDVEFISSKRPVSTCLKSTADPENHFEVTI